MRHRLALIATAALLLPAARPVQADAVTDWNATAVQAARDGHASSNEAARALAIVHIAINDATAPITRANATYHARLDVKGPASPEAAAAQAAHDTLAALFPAQAAAFDRALDESLGGVSDEAARAEGVRLGKAAAKDILSLRADDGSSISAEDAGEEKVGKWRPTPPDKKAAAQPHWAKVRPFAVVNVKDFRPLPPPAPDSVEYAVEFDKVKALGAASGGTRSAEQTEIARFWAQDTVLASNAIARDLAARRGLSLAQNVRLFALLNIALADARIVAWDAKYHFGFWRPVTAIREAADDGNPATGADPSWEPLLPTPPHPDYVSGHSITGAAGAAVLRRAFGDDVAFRVGSDTLADVTRSFESLTRAAEENGASRIYGGIHFAFANRAGLTAGYAVGDLVSTLLPPHVPSSFGPGDGTLVIVGGGQVGPEIVERFVTLAGGPEAEVVLIPTAGGEKIDTKRAGEGFAKAFGLNHVTVLHTKDRDEADSEAFVAPLKTARAVWFGGGRHWRLVDSYLGTRVQREVEAVLTRGGVVGGTSAGATILGSFLVRGAREGNHVMVAKDYPQGLGYLKGVAIDQHILPRDREDDLVPVIESHPGLLGLGIDESTAVVVQGDRFEVVGRSVVAVHDGKDHDGERYYFLAPGERFDLKARLRMNGGWLPAAGQNARASAGPAGPRGLTVPPRRVTTP